MSLVEEISSLTKTNTGFLTTCVESIRGDPVSKAYYERYLIALKCAQADMQFLYLDLTTQELTGKGIGDAEISKVTCAYFRERVQKHLDDMNKQK